MASDLLAAGAAWMAGKLAGSAAHAVVYSRAGVLLPVQATVGRKVYRIVQDGVWLRIETRDFLVATAEMGALGLPQRGDQIDETIGAATTSYEVVGPGGEPEWEWSGTTRDRLRIHTLRITASA